MAKKANMATFDSIDFMRGLLLDTIVKLWKPVAAEIVASIADAIDAGDFGTAFKLAENIGFDAITEKLAELVQANCTMARVSGSQICMPADNGGYGLTQLPVEAHTPIVENAVAQFITSLQTNGADLLRTQTAAVIALIEKSRMIVKSDVGSFNVTTVRKAADEALAALLNDAVMRGGMVQVNIGANLATSRLVSYGSLTELQAQGATHYKWTSVLEPNTCAVCRGLHGRTFETAPALHRLDMALRSQDANDLKSLTPFAPTDKAGLGEFFQLTTGALQSRGYGMPPIHPHCQCYVVPTDSPLAQSWIDATISAVMGRANAGAAGAADEAA